MASDPEFRTVAVTKRNKVALIVLNRPNKYNAFNFQQYSDFANALKKCDADKDVNVIAVTGNGKYFSSGNDLSEFARNFSSGAPIRDTAVKAGHILRMVTTSIMNVRKPMICGVNGPAIGIAVTMLGMFDIVYAANNATFQTPFSALGQSPEGLSSFTFVQKMGLSKASEVLLLGKKLSATEAAQCSLISEVWPNEGFQDRLMSVASQMAKYPTNGLQKVKALIRSPYADIWEKVCDDEINLLVERWQSKECQQAIMEFFMKKKKASQKSKM